MREAHDPDRAAPAAEHADRAACAGAPEMSEHHLAVAGRVPPFGDGLLDPGSASRVPLDHLALHAGGVAEVLRAHQVTRPTRRTARQPPRKAQVMAVVRTAYVVDGADHLVALPCMDSGCGGAGRKGQQRSRNQHANAHQKTLPSNSGALSPGTQVAPTTGAPERSGSTCRNGFREHSCTRRRRALEWTVELPTFRLGLRNASLRRRR